MAAINSIKRSHSRNEYLKCLGLLKEGKGCAETGRILSIPTSTIRNWKLNYAKPSVIERKKLLTEELEDAIGRVINKSKSVPEVSRRIDCSYGSALTIIKNKFPSHFDRIKRKAHKLRAEQKAMTPELAYFLGVMFGDGYCGGPDQVKLGVIDKDFRDYFADVSADWLGIEPKLHEYTRRGRLYYEAHINSTDVRNFTFSFLKTKRVPREVMASSHEEVKCMFIKGFSDSEGSVDYRFIRLYNKNLCVLKSIKRLLIDVGFDPTGLNCTHHGRGLYALTIYPRNFVLFRDKVGGFTIKRKMQKLDMYIKAAAGI